MSAFVYHFKNFNVSVNYDSITFYPSPQCQAEAATMILMICENILNPSFIEPLCSIPNYLTFTEVNDAHNPQLHNGFHLAMNAIPDNVRWVFREDDDHNFYHQNDIADGDHMHCKVPFVLTKQRLNVILDLFVKHDVISMAEKIQFFINYNKHFQEASQLLMKSMTHDQEADTQRIFNYILNCKDNEILIDLHQKLLSPDYNYLRDFIPSAKKPKWQGTNSAEQVIQTSRAWATIEKNIAYQMAKNIETQVSVFSDDVAKERAEQLNKHAFFGIKRKANSFNTNQLYTTFKSGASSTFGKRYQSQKMHSAIPNSMIDLIKAMKIHGYSTEDIKQVLKANIHPGDLKLLTNAIKRGDVNRAYAFFKKQASYETEDKFTLSNTQKDYMKPG